MARRRKRKRPSAAATSEDPSVPPIGATAVRGGSAVRMAVSFRSPCIPAEFKLTDRARRRMARDVDLAKLLPILDRVQTRLSTLADLIAETHLEERTLRRKLEWATAHRPHDLLARIFLRDVARELASSDDALNEIATRFSIRESTLSHVFKRIVGTTIRAYRKRYRDAEDDDSPR